VSRVHHSQLISALRLFCTVALGERIEELPLARPLREATSEQMAAPSVGFQG
jgi:hypothetical protein